MQIERILSRNLQRLVLLDQEFGIGFTAAETESVQQALRSVIESREAAPMVVKPCLSGMANGFDGD